MHHLPPSQRINSPPRITLGEVGGDAKRAGGTWGEAGEMGGGERGGNRAMQREQGGEHGGRRGGDAKGTRWGTRQEVREGREEGGGCKGWGTWGGGRGGEGEGCKGNRVGNMGGGEGGGCKGKYIYICVCVCVYVSIYRPTNIIAKPAFLGLRKRFLAASVPKTACGWQVTTHVTYPFRGHSFSYIKDRIPNCNKTTSVGRTKTLKN